MVHYNFGSKLILIPRQLSRDHSGVHLTYLGGKCEPAFCGSSEAPEERSALRGFKVRGVGWLPRGSPKSFSESSESGGGGENTSVIIILVIKGG